MKLYNSNVWKNPIRKKHIAIFVVGVLIGCLIGFIIGMQVMIEAISNLAVKIFNIEIDSSVLEQLIKKAMIFIK